MQTLQRIVSLFQVLLCVEMKSQSGNVVTGTEGGSVEISCTYPDGYQYVSKYFCRDPCGYFDVLIKTETADKGISKGRYSILNTVSTQSITVTIKNLRLGDSGVYYCGVGSWAKDKLSKVVLTVRKDIGTPGSHHHHCKEVVVNTPELTASPLSTPQTKSTDLSSIPTGLHTTAGNSTTSPTTQSSHSFARHELPVYGGILGLLLCCVLVALVVLYRRRSNTQSTSPAQECQTLDPPPDQEEVCHVYDEMLAVYSLAGPANVENPSGTYSIIQGAPPAEEDCSPYSLITPH